MSAVPVVTPADLRAGGAAASARTRSPRVWLRTLSFAALALYGVQRWGELMRDPPGWRLLGLALLAVALATFVPLVRHLAADWPARSGRLLAGLLAAALTLATLPVAGLRWEWVIHVRIAVGARAIGHGLDALGGLLVPYLGHAYPVRLVMVLGAAVLLVDAAAALAYAPREIGDGRRAAAALPLIALAVVPATLVPPAAPALQGLLLFALLAVFLWGERIARDGVAAAVGVACAAGAAGGIAAPLIAPARAWVDYRAWAGGTPTVLAESFDWNQTYGPLHWPQDGRIVFTVHGVRREYWKAEDLGDFTGSAWVAGPTGRAALAATPALPAPPAALRRADTQTFVITLQALDTHDVIAGAGATLRPRLSGGVHAGAVPGTWVADQALGPGDTYAVTTYSPHPSAAQLQRGGRYPWTALAPDLTLSLPEGAANPVSSPITFPAFHRPLSVQLKTTLAGSPYARALSLARRLAARAATPDAFVAAVKAYLDSGQYLYDQRTARAQYPLLSFLFSTHRGYCQQFSGAMALLLRMGGVPARVATGFTPGAPAAGDRSFSVADLDAHAWVEVWFPRYGWVVFDPTPSSAPALGGNGAADSGTPGVLPGQVQQARNRPNGETLSEHPHGSTAARHRPRAAAAGGGGRHRGGGSGGEGWIAGAIVLGLLIAAAGVVVTRRRRRGILGRGDDPLAELERALARTGQPLGEATTLAGLEQRFAAFPAAVAYIRALRLGRYAPQAPGPRAVPTPAGRAALRGALASGRGLRGHLRALWALPPQPARAPRAHPRG